MEVVSGLGDGVFWVGLTAVLLERGFGAAGFGIAAIARLGPRALISAPAGVLADRLDRRWLLVSLDLLRGAVLVMLAFAAAGDMGPTGLLVLVAIGYTIAAPYRPALTSALPLVTGEDGLASANAQVSTVRQVMTFVGPLVGAVLVAAWSPTAAFVVDAASFLVAAVLIASIPALSDRFETGATNLTEQRHQWWRESDDWLERHTAPPPDFRWSRWWCSRCTSLAVQNWCCSSWSPRNSSASAPLGSGSSPGPSGSARSPPCQPRPVLPRPTTPPQR